MPVGALCNLGGYEGVEICSGVERRRVAVLTAAGRSRCRGTPRRRYGAPDNRRQPGELDPSVSSHPGIQPLESRAQCVGVCFRAPIDTASRTLPSAGSRQRALVCRPVASGLLEDEPSVVAPRLSFEATASATFTAASTLNLSRASWPASFPDRRIFAVGVDGHPGRFVTIACPAAITKSRSEAGAGAETPCCNPPRDC